MTRLRIWAEEDELELGEDGHDLRGEGRGGGEGEEGEGKEGKDGRKKERERRPTLPQNEYVLKGC